MTPPRSVSFDDDWVARELRELREYIERVEAHEHTAASRNRPAPSGGGAGALDAVFRQSPNSQSIDVATLEALDFTAVESGETLAINGGADWTITNTMVTVPPGIYIVGGGGAWQNPPVSSPLYIEVNFTELTFPGIIAQYASNEGDAGDEVAMTCAGWQQVFSSSGVRLRAAHSEASTEPFRQYHLYIIRMGDVP